MKKLLYFGNIPAPYTVKFLNELSKYLDVFALFERKMASDRNKEWVSNDFSSFSVKILKSIKIKKEMGLSFGFIKHVKKKYDFILIGNPLTPTGILAIYHLYLKKIKFGIISEGGFAGDGKNFKERIKKKILSKASYYFSGSSPGHEYFIKYGANKKNLFEYPFSSLFKNEILKRPKSDQEKELIRDKYNLGNQKLVLSVGRIIESKGYDILITIANELPHFKFIIVGGKASNQLIKQMNHLRSQNVEFVEHLDGNEIRDYFSMADVFVLLTRIDTYGLVINEAMSFGLPVITTLKCVAGIHLIENETNGFLIELDDLHNIQNKIEFILSNNDIKNKMAKNNINKISNHTIEKMAQTIFNTLISLNENFIK